MPPPPSLEEPGGAATVETGKNKNNKYFYVFIMLKDVQDLLFYFFCFQRDRNQTKKAYNEITENVGS